MAIGNILPMIAAASNRLHLPVVRKLVELGATTPETAQSFIPNQHERRLFEALLGKGIVVETSSGSYYVDEVRLANAQTEQLRLILGIAAASVIVAVVALVLLR